ncbi:MAG: PAS domain S-box protein [Planctomycetota bacterium]|nr:PAS domain S-box protein [Planctomycetota bacterium]
MADIPAQKVLDLMTQAVFWKDLDLNYAGANSVLAKIAGFESPEAMVGKNDYDGPWTKEEAEWYRKCDQRVIDSGEAEMGIVETQLNADGKKTWLETNKVPVRKDGKIIGVAGWFEDITERKSRELKLALAEEKYRAIVETAHEWMWEIDLAGGFTYTSPRVKELFEIDPDELMGKTHNALSHSSDNIDDIYFLLAQSGEPFSGVRVEYKRADGRVMTIESCGVAIKEENKETEETTIVGLRCVSRDVTSQVEGERELKEKYALIAAQREAISRLSTPIMQVWDGVLCLPVVGLIDTARSAEMTDNLLQAVVDQRARCVIVDVTGIEVMDTSTADLFIKMAKAIRLLGAHPVLTGISPSIAQTMAHIGVDLTAITTLRTLKDGLEAYLSGALDSVVDYGHREMGS